VPDNSPLHRDPSLTRRGFLGAVAGTLGAAALAACAKDDGGSDSAAAGTATAAAGTAAATATGGAANASGQSGQLGLGLQLYTVRAALQADLDATLAALAGAGYRHVETAGFHGRTAQEFKAALDRHGLRAAAMHVPIQALRADAAKVLAEAKLFGTQWVVCPWLDTAERTTGGYQRVGQDLARVADAWRNENMGVAYHNHDFEFAMVDGKMAFDTLFEAAGPNVKMELDLYWAVKAGQDPLAIARKYPGRIVLAHAKDAGPAPDRTMMDVGAGTIDFAGILGTLEQDGLQYAFVEHDEPKDAIATARAGLAHLTTLKL
jgi:sugar phosphate isomerase/epimerase